MHHVHWQAFAEGVTPSAVTIGYKAILFIEGLRLIANQCGVIDG